MRVSLTRGSRQLVLLVVITILCTVTSFAQISSIPDSESQTGFGGINSIVGTVFGPSGRPVETGIRVRLSTMTSGSRSMNTNSTGNFAFRGLPSGSYTITVDQDSEYKPVSHSVDVRQFQGSPAQTYTLNIRLEPKAGTTAAPGVINAELAKIPQSAQTRYTTAMALVEKSDHSGAIEELKKAIEEYPEFALAHNELGVQYLRLGKLNEADLAFESALKLNADAFPSNMNRGMVLVFLQRYSEAAPLLKKAVSLRDDSAPAHYFYGQALANLGLFDQAEKELVIALKSGQAEMNEGHRILAIIYNSRGDKKKAVTHLEAYLKGNPKAADAEQLQALVKQLKASQ
jgi:Flp pilus assembly protein TadD